MAYTPGFNGGFDPVPGEYQLAVIPLAAQAALNTGNLTAWNQIQLAAPSINEIPNLSVAGNVLNLPIGQGFIRLVHSFEIDAATVRGALRYQITQTGEVRYGGFGRGGTASLRFCTDILEWSSKIAAPASINFDAGRIGNTGTITTDAAASALHILWRELPF
jgi:hypothetical protein